MGNPMRSYQPPLLSFSARMICAKYNKTAPQPPDEAAGVSLCRIETIESSIVLPSRRERERDCCQAQLPGKRNLPYAGASGPGQPDCQELLAGPEKPEDFPAWLAGMRIYRQEMQALIQASRGDMADAYAEPALQWAQRSFIQPQMMAHERYFYDPIARRYTVRRYLHDLRARYGGIDSVLIWPTYPNMGVDDRNQFDLWHDMPGGLDGLRRMVAEFHREGVHVLIPIMIWDNGTRDEGTPMPQAINELARAIGADGFNGDTMMPVDSRFLHSIP